MKYSKIHTEKHPVSESNLNCLTEFDNLNFREGFTDKNNLFGKNIIVLDLDCVEAKNAKLAKINRKSSVDCTFAIKDTKTQFHEMLLVELRYNYANLKNLNRQKLIDKVMGSTSVLGTLVPIHPNSIFIFKSDLKAQAESRLFRMNPKVPSTYIVMDLNELKRTFFD